MYRVFIMSTLVIIFTAFVVTLIKRMSTAVCVMIEGLPWALGNREHHIQQQVTLRACSHVHQLCSASNLFSSSGPQQRMKLHPSYVHIQGVTADSHTHYCLTSEPISTLKHCIAFSVAAGASAARPRPTDFDRRPWWESDPAPSAKARGTGSYIEKGKMCVHQCQDGYRAWHLHDGKLCQFIRHLKEPGHFSKLHLKKKKGTKIAWQRRKYSAGTVYQRECFLWQVARDIVGCSH